MILVDWGLLIVFLWYRSVFDHDDYFDDRPGKERHSILTAFFHDNDDVNDQKWDPWRGRNDDGENVDEDDDDDDDDDEDDDSDNDDNNNNDDNDNDTNDDDDNDDSDNLDMATIQYVVKKMKQNIVPKINFRLIFLPRSRNHHNFSDPQSSFSKIKNEDCEAPPR